VRFDTSKSELLDSVIKEYLRDHPDLPERWLLEQDLFTGPARRALLSSLILDNGWTLLDAGCGFGVIPFELAGQLQIEIHGVDVDEAKLQVARDIQVRLQECGYLDGSSTITFGQGNLETLDFSDEVFDFVYVSFVYQYLKDPESVTDEFYRVLRPGGSLCIVDADDGLSLIYPEPSAAYSNMSEAFAKLQASNGGDRNVGRKLASFLDGTGFDVIATLILPAAEYRSTSADEPGRRFLLGRFAEARKGIVDAGIMNEGDFDKNFESLRAESALLQYRTNAQIIAVGRRPAS